MFSTVTLGSITNRLSQRYYATPDCLHGYPETGALYPVLRGLAKFILRAGGWTAVGDLPDTPRAVFIAAPHTSNWDAFWALVYTVSINAEIHFFAKNTVFWFPLGTILRALGGIPLDRSRAGAAVQLAVDKFNTNDLFYFGLAPEGTRKKTDGWKSGFYRIAERANVPVYLGFLDYKHKRLGIGRRLDLSGDQEADLQVCRDFYADIEGRWPDKTSPIQFA